MTYLVPGPANTLIPYNPPQQVYYPTMVDTASYTAYTTASAITLGQITASTIRVNTLVSNIVSSSTDYSSGSNIFGNLITNVQQFTGSVNITGGLYIGNLPVITDVGIISQYTVATNSYEQSVWQNTNTGSSASTDIVINNNLGTSSSFYTNLGKNSSTYSGTGPLNIANAGYLFDSNNDLVVGTLTSSNVHIVVNNTDALFISGSNGNAYFTSSVTAPAFIGTASYAATASYYFPVTGTFQPTTASMVATNNSGSVTFTGSYIKIGPLVELQIFIDITGNATLLFGAGASMGNLPFPAVGAAAGVISWVASNFANVNGVWLSNPVMYMPNIGTLSANNSPVINVSYKTNS